jgi:uncharacterized protein (TIGR02265 family)
VAPLDGEKPRIKGNVLIARLKFIRAKGGESAERSILQRLAAPDQEVLRGWILPISWYPIDLYLRLDDAIAAVLSPENRSRIFLEMGRASADANLGGAQAPYLKQGDPHFLLRNAPQIYAAYYAKGRRTYEKTGERSAILRTIDAENVTATDCLTVVGWHERGIELCGGREPHVVETRCRTRGDSFCEYTCEWK